MDTLNNKSVHNKNKNMKKITIEIGNLFDAIERYENVNFEENSEYFQNTDIQIQDEYNNWVDIKGIIFKFDEVCRIETDNEIFRTAVNHKICYNKVDCKIVKNLKVGDTLIKSDNEISTISSLKTQPKEKVFDFEIDSSTHLYQTSNKIIHHNTLLACQIALDMFFQRKVNKIIITRPTVSNEDNGYLPGSLNEKMEPWLVPIRSNMRKVYNKPALLEKMEKDEDIELVSLSHFRGRTFENSCIIVDEFQNLTKGQLRMVLGRLGKGSTMILTGDSQQIDLKFINDSAVHDVSRVKSSQYVFSVALKDNHRHAALDDILKLLEEFS